jgi:(p)ppGpp synthase/HD superfamily hydrolase
MYSPRVELAVATALEAHGLSRRKAGRGFEISHVTSVAMIAADYGCDEDTIVAALLHDTLEDTALEPDVIRSRFGPLVLAMVQDVSEPPKPHPWRARKEAYIEQLRATPRAGARAVASADKIHNLSKMTQGLRTQGHPFIRPFSAPLDEMVWYQRAVLATLQGAWSHAILEEHARQTAAFLAAAAAAAESAAT